MRRYFSAAILILFVTIRAFAQTPPELYGIWRGDDRCIFFGDDGNISVILKEYSGWYYDRAAESAETAKTIPRTVNAATSPEAQHVTARYTRLQDGVSAWEIFVTYGKKSVAVIPAAVIDEKLYLNFLLCCSDTEKMTEAQTSGNNNGTTEAETADAGALYWQGVNYADSIRIHERNAVENINAWYETGNTLYKLRFWQTDMDYDDSAKASFSDGSHVFSVKKHIQSAGQTYTAASGRGKIIRNVEKYGSFPFAVTIYADADGNKRLCAIGSAYLEKVTTTNAKDELIKIVTEANARKKPAPPPLFEKKELDWHWDLINELEKDNALIQKVRKRQKTFGPRGKETEQ